MTTEPSLQKLPDDAPIMVAWNAWKASPLGEMAIGTYQDKVAEAWAAFQAGWTAAGKTVTPEQ